MYSASVYAGRFVYLGRIVNSMSVKVCAVTATQNRCAVLQRWVNALRAQSYPLHKIIIVNNESTDGTAAWLAAQKDVQTLTQCNSGSAGGFHTGMTAALESDCDWVWLLDDDIIATPDALGELVRGLVAHPEARVLNSFCVGIQNTARPSSGALSLRTSAEDFLRGQYLYTREAVQAQADAAGMLDSAGGQLYQGTLLHRAVIENIGTPTPWFFTRGDEVEYALRIMQAGYHIWIVTKSIVMHPDAPITYFKVGANRLPFEQMSALKRYYSIRNSIYLRRTYYGKHPFIPYVVRRVVGALVTEWIMGRKRSWREKVEASRAAARGAWDGIRAGRGQTRSLDRMEWSH